MKIPAALLILIVASEYLHASAGPPPFTNGSPLVSGVDGSYQATARGKNLTGVFRFTYSSGRQTSSPQLPTGNTVASLLTDPYNDYVFFVEGVVFRGLVQANINVNSVAGVLDNGGANVPNFGGESSPTATPAASPNASPGTNQSFTQTSLTFNGFMNGFFNGSIDQNSPYACFRGKGQVVVTTAQSETVVELVTIQVQELVPGTGTSADNPPVFNTVPQVVAQTSTQNFFGPNPPIDFKFRGVRNATGTTVSTTTTTTTTGTTTSF